MDIAHNKISQELPFDAVSNQINQSITVFKDGKDASLAGGETDRVKHESVLDAFYARLKKDLVETDKHNNVTSKGCELGRFMITKDNDVVERATESLGSEQGSSIIPVMNLMLRNQVIPISAGTVKLSKSVRDVAKKGFVKSLPKLSVPDYSKIKDTYVKNIIEQTVGDKIVESSFANLRDYLRDIVNVFSVHEDDMKQFLDRYTKRYALISDISSKLALAVNEILTAFSQSFKSNPDGTPTSEAKERIDIALKAVNLVTDLYSKLISPEYTDDTDIFTIVNQKYKLDVLTFAAKKINEYSNDYEGVTKADLDNFISRNPGEPIGENEKIVFTTLSSPKGVEKIITGIQSKYGPAVAADTMADKQARQLFTVVDDMTVEEFYKAIEKFNNSTKDFKSNVDETLVRLIDSTTRTANIVGTLATYTLNKINEFRNLQNPADYNLAILVMSIATWTCLDLMTVVNALHYTNANDLVLKTYLYENTVNFAKYIDDCIQSWRK